LVLLYGDISYYNKMKWSEGLVEFA